MAKYMPKEPIEAVQFFKSKWKVEYDELPEDKKEGGFSVLSYGVMRIAAHQNMVGSIQPNI